MTIWQGRAHMPVLIIVVRRSAIAELFTRVFIAGQRRIASSSIRAPDLPAVSQRRQRASVRSGHLAHPPGNNHTRPGCEHNRGNVMLSSAWDFVKDPDNRAVLGWVGGGITAIAAGIWTVVRFRAGNNDKPSKPAVSADRGSVAAGGDIVGSPVNIDARDSYKR
jgi:hypothetical protein